MKAEAGPEGVGKRSSQRKNKRKKNKKEKKISTLKSQYTYKWCTTTASTYSAKWQSRFNLTRKDSTGSSVRPKGTNLEVNDTNK
jgi:hypothetical protein